MSHYTDTTAMAADLQAATALLREVLHRNPASEAEWDALATVETFCAIALRVFAKTNPSKVRAEAVTVEIQSLMPPGARK